MTRIILFLLCLIGGETLIAQSFQTDVSYSLGRSDRYVYSNKIYEDFLTQFGGYDILLTHNIRIEIGEFVDGRRQQFTLKNFSLSLGLMDVKFNDPFGSRVLIPGQISPMIRDTKIIEAHAVLVGFNWNPSYYTKIWRSRNSQLDFCGLGAVGYTHRVSHRYTSMNLIPDNGEIYEDDSQYSNVWDVSIGASVGVRYLTRITGDSYVILRVLVPSSLHYAIWSDYDGETKTELELGYFQISAGIAF